MTVEYQRLSRYRSELMGLAALWVMLFHAYPFKFGFFPLDAFKQIGLRVWIFSSCSPPWDCTSL